jgi:hypothetical protein
MSRYDRDHHHDHEGVPHRGSSARPKSKSSISSNERQHRTAGAGSQVQVENFHLKWAALAIILEIAPDELEAFILLFGGRRS